MGKEEFIQKFDSIFRTSFHKLKEEELTKLITENKQKLELKDSHSINLLLILAYAYLGRRGFVVDNEVIIKDLDKKVINQLKKIFRKPLISEPLNGDFLLIVTKKTKKDVDADDIDKLVKVYKGSDIIYVDKKNKRLVYTKGDSAKNIRKLFNEEKLIALPVSAKTVNFDPFKRILESNDLDIFEIEFRSVNLPSLKGLYIKTGSKQDKINKKINEILKTLLEKSILRVSNIKSIHLGLKNCDRKESSSLIITTPRKLGVYNIKWRGKPPEELENFIRNGVLKDLLYVDLVDGNVNYSEKILNYFLGKKIPKAEYEENIKSELEKWDKSKLLKYELQTIKPNYAKIIEIINKAFQNENTIKQVKIKISSHLSKMGILMKNKKNSKEIFIFLNKRNTKKETIDLMINNDKPILILDFSDNLIDEIKRFNFLRINEKGTDDLISKVLDISNHGKFYRKQRERFLGIGSTLDNIGQELQNKKTSQGKGSLWENVCEDLLDYVFNRSFKLSGPDFPDGRTYWHSGNEGFLWDGKALLKTDLKNSILDKKKKPKDLAYINVFRKKIDLDYYIYLSYGVSKEEFENVKNILEKRYKGKAKFTCITEKGLKNLKDLFLDEARASMLHKNSSKLIANFKKILDNGFVDSIKLDALTFGMNNDDTIDSKKLRIEVKKEKEKLLPINK